MRSIVVLSGETVHTDPWHALAQTSRRIAEVLDDRLGDRFAVRVAGTSAGPGALRGADVIVVNTSADFAVKAVGAEEIVDALIGHSERGGGILGVHSAAMAFFEDSRWPELLGGRWVPGATSHPPIDEALVRGTTAAGAPADFTVYDERYTSLGVRAGSEVLAFHTDADYAHPLVWRREAAHGQGRTAYDGLGHGVESYDSPGRRALLCALTEWVAS